MKFIAGRYQGKKLCSLTMQEYSEKIEKNVLDNQFAYVIVDKNNCLVNEGYIVGQVNTNSIKIFPDKSQVITERPTVEAFIRKSDDKVEEVIKSAQKVEELALEGKTKLEEIVAESQVKAAAIRKKRYPVKKVEVEPTNVEL